MRIFIIAAIVLSCIFCVNNTVFAENEIPSVLLNQKIEDRAVYQPPGKRFQDIFIDAQTGKVVWELKNIRD